MFELLKKRTLMKVLKETAENLRGFWFEENYMVCSDGHFLFWKELDERKEEPVFIGLDGFVKKVTYPAWRLVIPQEWLVEIELDWSFTRQLKHFLKMFRGEYGYMRFEIVENELRVTKIGIYGFSFILEKPIIFGYVLEESERIEQVYLNLLYLKLLLELMEMPWYLKLRGSLEPVYFVGI